MVDQLDQFLQGTIIQQENIYETTRALQQKQQECEYVEEHTEATQGILGKTHWSCTLKKTNMIRHLFFSFLLMIMHLALFLLPAYEKVCVVYVF